MKSKQYEFSMVNGKQSTTVRCTAPNERYARAQIENKYRNWTVGNVVAIHAAHRMYGEIDASDMTEDDYQYVLRIMGV